VVEDILAMVHDPRSVGFILIPAAIALFFMGPRTSLIEARAKFHTPIG